MDTAKTQIRIIVKGGPVELAMGMHTWLPKAAWWQVRIVEHRLGRHPMEWGEISAEVPAEFEQALERWFGVSGDPEEEGEQFRPGDLLWYGREGQR
jgi:hypothetical protein